MYGQFENTFMMYLPRLCEHCLNPACVAVCPSGSIYKREEDGIVLIDQDKCRGWRMCVSGCPYKKIYYNWKSGKAEKCTFCYPRIEAGQPTVCSETCVGRIRYLGVLLYDADRIQEAASVEHDRDLYQAQLDIFLDPNDPKVIAQARIDGIPDAWMEARPQEPGLQNGRAMEGRPAAAPRVPHAAHGLVCATAVAHHRGGQRGPHRHQRRDSGCEAAAHSRQVPGQPADRRRHRSRWNAPWSACWPCAPTSASKHVDGKIKPGRAEPGADDVAEVEEMYHVMAIANYEDRFVIPTTHREYAENTFDVRGGCGFTFGNGCSDGPAEVSLFGSEKKRTIPIKAEV